MNGQVAMMRQATFEEANMDEKMTKAKRLGELIDQYARMIGNQIDRKHLSALVDKEYTTVCGWLNTNGGGRPHPVDVLGAYVVEIPDAFIEGFIAPICDLCGYDAPLKKTPQDPEKQLRGIKQRLEALKLSEHPDFKEYFR